MHEKKRGPEKSQKQIKKPTAPGLRYGEIASLYDDILGEKPPRQLDLIDRWFPGLVIVTDPSDGLTKTPAFYADYEYVIHAVRYHGKLYAGGSTRISQIAGRLTGTAAGNQEKERKAAELIRKHAAECFVRDMELVPALQEHAAACLDEMTDAQLSDFYQLLFDRIFALADAREQLDDYARKTEPVAMDDEVYDGVLYHAAYQLNLATFQGLVNAYLWLLTGSLLRNEAGRVLRLYDSSFIAVRRQVSADGTLADKLDKLFHPEKREYSYHGDAFDSRFPDVEWYCDGCGAHLNAQDGFDDHLPEWTCTACGTVNPLRMSEIYENHEDFENGIRAVDPEKFSDAVRRRAQEVEGREDGGT